jgi:uncharacterized protein YkwD
MENGFADQINAYRQSRSLPALAVNTTLSNIARKHSEEMASGMVDFGHIGFDDRVGQLRTALASRGACDGVAENVAWNIGYDDPVKQAVDELIASPAHLENIAGNYALTGVGAAADAEGGIYFTELFCTQ